MSRHTVLLAALTLLAGPAAAATLRVPQDHATVQAAIDAALPGDVVLISGGPYAETVVIDGRDEITLKGKGKPSIGGVATDVLTIRGGSTEILLDGLVIENSPEDGVLVKDSTDITIRRCEVRNVDDGIRLESSTRVLVEKNRLENIGNDAIDMDDAGDTVPPNVDCRILKNRISNSDEDGITLNGSGHWVGKNRIELISDQAIEADPNSFGILIEKNRVERVDGTAMEIDGSAHTIAKNRVKDGGNDGIKVRAGDSLVEKNRVDDVDEDGIDIEGPDNDVIKNKVRKANEDGIEVGNETEEDATGNRFEKNNVTQSGDNGFKVSDGANEFVKNKASKSSGFDLLDESGTTTNVYDGNKFGTQSGP